MEPNKYDIEMLKRVPRFSRIIESVENNDTLISVNEPDQNMLNFMSSKGYILVNCVQFGINEEGMGYNCIFRRSFTNYMVQGSASGRVRHDSIGDSNRHILTTPGIMKRSSEYDEGIKEPEKSCKDGGPHRIVNAAGALYCGDCGKDFDD